MSEKFDEAYWEARYSHHAGHGRPRPSPQLVAEVGSLAPGTALDAGCGEGANTIWLASREWRVTGLDISATALRRARENAAPLGDITNRIDWVRADLTTWAPEPARFDLVTAHYVHPAGPFEDLVARLAAAVVPGGTLLVVDHDAAGSAHEHNSPAMARTVEEMAAGLDLDQWETEVAETRHRTDTDPHGSAVEFHDAVLRARRH